MKVRNRSFSTILSLMICLSVMIPVLPAKKVQAADKYIKADTFIQYLVTELELPVDQSSVAPYLDAAMKAGIVKEGDFKDYSSYLTRTDCAVLANRADEYINGSHYGYTDEVYEFLKDCEFLKGKLYYNTTKGSLYPKGMTNRTYPSQRFLEEIVLPKLNLYFKFKGDLLAYYETTENALYIEIGYDPGKDSILQNILPFEEDEYLIQAWKNIVDGDRKVQAVYQERISDLNKVEKEKRQDVAEIVAKGIIKGYSNGMYIQNRQFRGSSKISASGAKTVIDLVLKPSKRARISPDGQLIRTKNLPKNADQYPYILECFPNKFYEMPFDFCFGENFQNGTLDRDYYDYPVDFGEGAISYIYQNFISLGMKPCEYYDKIMDQAYQYVSNVLNVDYRTVDKEWVEKVASSYVPFRGDNIYDEINEYLNMMKKNHVVVESKVIALEPSTLYRVDYSYYVRVYVKYRISADTLEVKEDNQLVFGNHNSIYLVGLKMGEWTYGYYDIQVGGSNENNPYYMQFGVDPWVGISDWALRGSK